MGEIHSAEAPANIALIKYMGKKEAAGNQPTNSSLSYTLNHLLSRVEIMALPQGEEDRWEPLRQAPWEILTLSPEGQARFLKFFRRLKGEWKIPGSYLLRSANNFPADCGVASSASSFAALTRATFELARSESEKSKALDSWSQEDLARWSRQGSGSSCRSFFSPWSLWQGEGARGVALPWPHLHHQLVLVETEKKQVASSSAHLRVSSSLLFTGRPERAELRLESLLQALNMQNWAEAFEWVWAEMWDMHALFETSSPSFGYMTPASLRVLLDMRRLWQEEKDGPLVTMDAGANVHLLWRPDQREMALNVEAQVLGGERVLRSPGLVKQ